MRDIYNMIIRRALSEVKKKIRPRPPGGSRFGFKPGPGSRAGGKNLLQGHERRTAGRFAEAETGLPEHPPDKDHSHWRWRRYRPWPLRSLRRSAHAYRVPGGYWHSALPGRRTPPDCQPPNDVPYRHPNEAADACFFFIF